MPHWPKYIHNSLDYTLSAERTLFVLSKLENPHLKLKNVVQITGTNGKGSVSKYISKILKSHGGKVCLYTSPHIHYCNERAVFNDSQIDDDSIFKFTEIIRDICEKERVQLSFFESFTVMSILWFSTQDHDFCVLEVGAGGLCDATNVFFDNQIACVFTPIDIDHVDILGNSLKSVIAHKVGLIQKSCKYVVSSKQNDCFFEILERNLKRIDLQSCQVLTEGQDFEYKNISKDRFTVKTLKSYDLKKPNLIGNYQLQNAALAVSVCEALLGKLDEEKLSIGLQVDHFCRMEEVEAEGGPNLKIFIDGAHNPHGTKILTETLNEEFKEYDVYLVVARSFHEGDENNIAFFKNFLELKKLKIVYVSRAIEVIPESVEKLYFASSFYNLTTVKTFEIKEALALLLKQNFKSKTLIVICGSLYCRRDLLKINLVKA